MSNSIKLQQKMHQRAALAHVLFLLNISLLPVVAFVLLLILYKSPMTQSSNFCRHHYRQSIVANLFAGVFLLVVSLMFLYWGDLHSAYTWMAIILYFTLLHSVLLLLGVLALVKARSGKTYQYPIIGKLWVVK
ncbi:MAG: hypothetical protein Q9M92_04595 [Enterobacterales bacterium]|nr:hypothetical protein [Enterobacterales bacterium]